jgi:hypothetical protein
MCKPRCGFYLFFVSDFALYLLVRLCYCDPSIFMSIERFCHVILLRRSCGVSLVVKSTYSLCQGLELILRSFILELFLEDQVLTVSKSTLYVHVLCCLFQILPIFGTMGVRAFGNLYMVPYPSKLI